MVAAAEEEDELEGGHEEEARSTRQRPLALSRRDARASSRAPGPLTSESHLR